MGMITTSFEAAAWTLRCDGRAVIEHSPQHPFVFAVRREKTYKLSRGRASVSQKIIERTPLESVAAGEGGFVFSGGGRALNMRVEELSGGFAARFSGEKGWGYEFHFPSAGESVFGGGEQYRRLDLKSGRVANFVSEHITASTVLQKALLPAALYREKEQKDIGSYSPMPVFAFSDKHLIAFDTASDGESSFEDNGSVFSFDECPAGFSYLYADSFAGLSRLTASLYPNRQYLPGWCLDGMILGVQGGTDTVVRKAFDMLDAGAKVCGVWCQDWCGEKITAMGKQVNWNWEADEGLYPGLRQAIEKLEGRGVRFLAYINPYLVKDGPLYSRCRESGFLITHRDGSIYHIKSTTFDAGMLDLTNPRAVSFIKDTLIKENMLSLGVKGYMADFGEYLPVDCVLHDGDPALLHNQWPVLWAKINREAVEEYGDKDVFFFTRSGYLGIQSYAPVMWNGDQHTDWTRDYGMPCVMPASFSLGFSGVTLVHSDIGGFFSFGKLRRNSELFVRWMEMNAFTPLMRSHESLRPDKNAQFDAPDVRNYTAALTKLHAELRPYFEDVLKDCAEGLPAIRPDFYAGDYSEHREDYAFFSGGDIFAAPVIRPGETVRELWLPQGEWRHFFTGAEFSGRCRVDTPLGVPPVFYRKGCGYEELFRSAASDYIRELKER
jgi:alpha-glucosidase